MSLRRFLAVVRDNLGVVTEGVGLLLAHSEKRSKTLLTMPQGTEQFPHNSDPSRNVSSAQVEKSFSIVAQNNNRGRE